MRALVLVNHAAGTISGESLDHLTGRLRASFTAHSVEAEIVALHGPKLRERAREAARVDVDVVVAVGGDGTVSTVAGALAGTDKPLGVLPLGTLNHFAKDLGVPLVLDEAVRTIAAGHQRRVDVGEVNGHVFINNCSLGVYPQIVRQREERRLRRGFNKWLALALACLSVFRRHPLLTVRLAVGANSERLTTPLLFVGNNQYETNLLAVRGRAALDRGELCVYLVRGRSRFTLPRLALLALVGRLSARARFPGVLPDGVSRGVAAPPTAHCRGWGGVHRHTAPRLPHSAPGLASCLPVGPGGVTRPLSISAIAECAWRCRRSCRRLRRWFRSRSDVRE